LLLRAYQIKTKQGKEGQLIVKRFASSPPDVTGRLIQMYAMGDQIAEISEWSNGQWRGHVS
jgi:hypothetical protein